MPGLSGPGIFASYLAADRRDPRGGDRRHVARQIIDRSFDDALDFPRPARRSVTNVLDDQKRGEVALEIRLLLNLGGESDAPVRHHPDFLTELTQDGVARI